MPLQTLEAAGFTVDKQSLDRDKAAYTAWRTGFEDWRIRLYRSEELLEEAEKLMETDKKYDHPNLGSKDTSDSSAGAYYNAVNSEERSALLSEAVPSIHGNSMLESQADKERLENMNLPMPMKTLRTVKEYSLK